MLEDLPSGIYEVRASLMDGEGIINSISSYVVIKQNTLVQPRIEYESYGDRVDIRTIFTKDTFYDELKAKNYDDPFVGSFIDTLSTNYKTKYSTNLIDRMGTEDKTVHKNPSFNASKEYRYDTSTQKFVTVVATVEDAFGNSARHSQVIDFFENPTTGPASGGTGTTGKEINDAPINVKIIETPSAENLIINGRQTVKDEINYNPFDFLKPRE